MDFERLWVLWLIVPAWALLAVFAWQSTRVWPVERRWALFLVRCGVTALGLLAIAGPAWPLQTNRESVMFVLDHSQSQGTEKWFEQAKLAERLAARLPASTAVGYVSVGQRPRVVSLPVTSRTAPVLDPSWCKEEGHDSNVAEGVALARALMPSATAHRVVVLGDGMETRGDLLAEARRAAAEGVVIDVVPLAGEARPDVRVVGVEPSRARLHERAELDVRVDVESSLEGAGTIRLFENGVEVEAKPLELHVGDATSVTFRRTPDRRNLYSYRAVVEGFPSDTIPENDESLAMVDVQGLPVLLYIEGEEGEAEYLTTAMAKEGIRLVTRPASAIPTKLADMAGYDGVIFSDIPATKMSELQMVVIRDYVEQLGGGFLMIGGKNSFGVGGYYRTPIEDILPVKMKAPDNQEKVATALALVVDRSSSMSGDKIELCKSAAIATVDLLQSKDYVAVVAFDSSAHWVVPMTRVTSPSEIAGRIATLNSEGGTNIQPGMEEARKALASVNAKVKHMIVLTDGQTSGGNYEQLATEIRKEGVTISTVGVGSDAAVGLLQVIATIGGGQFYTTHDTSQLPRIFTQDAMTHMGKLIREEPFLPRSVERHEVTRGWPVESAPQLLGYVKTRRKATAQVPLVTDADDPLLASWRFGLGKVMAFTSDCKSRWSALWIATWPDGYSQMWSQILREMARQPQGQLMDLRLSRGASGRAAAGSESGIDMTVDLMADAAQFRQGARIEYEAFMVPAHALDSTLEPIGKGVLDQIGPGRYAGHVATKGAGVYLVRARSDSEVVSAGLVENISGESATGSVRTPLFENVASLTGGTLLSPDAVALPTYARSSHAEAYDFRPVILGMLVMLFLVDVIIRRFEVAVSLLERVRGRGAS